MLSWKRAHSGKIEIKPVRTIDSNEGTEMRYRDLINKVDEFEADYWLAECLYSGAIDGLKAVRNDLEILDDIKHVKRIIRPFLILWGSMGRVVGRENIDWKGLGKTLRRSEKEFSILRKERFVRLKFDSKIISDNVLKLYENLDHIPYVRGPTTVSKILHLLNPEIFVMWDKAIRDHYKMKNNSIRDSAKGYLEFLIQTQKEIIEALTERQPETGKGMEEAGKDISARYKQKTLARIIDEYNWTVAHH
jgi:hypothetical protein